MDIALDNRLLDLYDGSRSTRIYTEDTYSVPQYIGPQGSITRSIANQGSVILGKVDCCVISSDAVVEENAVCTKCVIMAGARVKVGAKVNNAIIAPNVVVEENARINLKSDKVVLIAKGGKK